MEILDAGLLEEGENQDGCSDQKGIVLNIMQLFSVSRKVIFLLEVYSPASGLTLTLSECHPAPGQTGH